MSAWGGDGRVAVGGGGGGGGATVGGGFLAAQDLYGLNDVQGWGRGWGRGEVRGRDLGGGRVVGRGVNL